MKQTDPNTINHLKQLENESIYIMREVIAEFNNPAMLYSIGKDSSVMLHLALKAFYPSKLPFSLLHVDTTWKFGEMIEFRDRVIKKYGLNLIVHTNEDGVKNHIDPFEHGASYYTNIMKTVALKQALTTHKFDAVFGGARRDEEQSRAKERIFSFRNSNQTWNPKQQRPELWNIYNTRVKEGESVRVFPLSNWTEEDIWEYILLENIDIVPLYFAKKRPVIERDNQIIMVDDDRLALRDGEQVEEKIIRFRTLGCYPLTAAILSTADNLPKIIQEIRDSTTSERSGRLIDYDELSAMERKKREGYF